MMIQDHNKTALVSGSREITYTELISYIRDFAHHMKRYRSKKIAIFCENRPEWIYAYYGSWELGCTNIPIDMMSSEGELEYILRDSQPKLIVCSDRTFDRVKNAVSRLPLTKKPEVMNVDRETPRETDRELPPYQPSDDDVRLILYTSGTTGSSKGVMLTHKNIMKNVRWNNDSKRINETDRLLAVLPTHHSWPLMATVLCPLDCGATIVFLPELNAEALISTMKNNAITMLTGVPRLFEMLHGGVMREIRKNPAARAMLVLCRLVYRMPGNRIFGRVGVPYATMDVIPFTKAIFKKVHETFGGNIKIFISGGAKLDPNIILDFCAMGIPMVEGYGLTETAPMVTYHPFDRIRIGSVGRVFDEIDIRFSHDHEIEIKGPNVTPGYYKKPDENEANFTGDGYFRTGDLGYIDSERYLYLTGRRKDLIILSNGKNVRPDIIESQLKGDFELVKDAAVTASGNHLFAVIVPDMTSIRSQNISNVNESIKFEVIDAYNRKAENYRKIHDFMITTDDLPRTRMGKLKRYMLDGFIREKQSRERVVETDIPPYAEYRTVAKYLADVSGMKVHPDDHIEIDLGLDSLEMVELQLFLRKRFGVSVEETRLPEYSVVRDLAEYVREKRSAAETGATDWKEMLAADIEWNVPKRMWMLNVLHALFTLVYSRIIRLTGEGSDRIPDGPCIIAPNHVSFLDSMAVFSVMKLKHRSELFFLAKEKNFRNPFCRLFARNAHVVIMDINRDLVASLQKIASLLRQGKKVMIFPEGTRSRDGKIQKFKSTFAQIAKTLSVPVVPVAIQGAYEVMPHTRILPKSGRVTVSFLEIIDPQGLSEEKITTMTRDAIIKVIGQE